MGEREEDDRDGIEKRLKERQEWERERNRDWRKRKRERQGWEGEREKR